jgi:hypothetical protein
VSPFIAAAAMPQALPAMTRLQPTSSRQVIEPILPLSYCNPWRILQFDLAYFPKSVPAPEVGAEAQPASPAQCNVRRHLGD